MERSALLSPADVKVIRRYVRTKYAAMSEAQRSEIVATAVLQTIRRRLPELPEPIKGQIAEQLIHRCLVGEQRPILPDDVLNVCMTLDWPNSDQEFLILDPLLQWMNERAPGRWSLQTLTNRLLGEQTRSAASLPTAEAAVCELPHSPVDPGTNADAGKLRTPPMSRLAWSAAALSLAVGIAAGLWMNEPQSAQLPEAAPLSAAAAVTEPLYVSSPDMGMPSYLRYHDIDVDAVKAYLTSRDSMLADEPYFSAIVDSAKAHDVHPLLLFAISGQEQGFVPKTNKNASKIANNPFNVFHSWERFNTDIAQASDIAARTVSRQGAKRPEGFEPFAWLNETYAEDPNWSVGVRLIFEKLNGLSAPSEVNLQSRS